MITQLSCPDARRAPDGPRQQARRRWPCEAAAMKLQLRFDQCRKKVCRKFDIKQRQSLPSFSIDWLCALPTWWFWRGGCTRSHSEHGRETPQRRWYFVLRHGRVGRCQVCKTQNQSPQNDNQTAIAVTLKGRPQAAYSCCNKNAGIPANKRFLPQAKTGPKSTNDIFAAGKKSEVFA